MAGLGTRERWWGRGADNPRATPSPPLQNKSEEKLANAGGLAGVASALRTDLHAGVSTRGSVGLDTRRQVFGVNVFPTVPPKSFFRLWLTVLKARRTERGVVCFGREHLPERGRFSRPGNDREHRTHARLMQDPTLIMLMAAALVSGVVWGKGAFLEGSRESGSLLARMRSVLACFPGAVARLGQPPPPGWLWAAPLHTHAHPATVRLLTPTPPISSTGVYHHRHGRQGRA